MQNICRMKLNNNAKDASEILEMETMANMANDDSMKNSCVQCSMLNVQNIEVNSIEQSNNNKCIVASTKMYKDTTAQIHYPDDFVRRLVFGVRCSVHIIVRVDEIIIKMLFALPRTIFQSFSSSSSSSYFFSVRLRSYTVVVVFFFFFAFILLKKILTPHYGITLIFHTTHNSHSH